MTTIYPRRVEMDVTYLPATPPADAAWRVNAEGFLQLKDAADGKFRSLFLDGGNLIPGEAED